MKFIIEKNNLLENLNKVSKAITGNSTNQILQCVNIQVQNGKIILFGTDMDLSIAAFGSCEVIEEGSMLVDAKMFIEIIRKLPNKEVSISLNKDNLIEITCGKSLFNIVHMNEKEYPRFPKEKDGAEITVSKDKFRRMIGQVGYAIAQDSSRPILQGILVEVKNNLILKLVALDGYRIAYSSSEIDTSVNNISAVIDGKSLINISKLIDNVGSMKLYLHKNHIEFRLDNMIIFSRLLEGKYVAYEQLFPSDTKDSITCNRLEFIEAIERSCLIAKDSTNPFLKFNIAKDILEITAKSNKGKGREELSITRSFKENENLEIAFNGRYLLDMARNIESEKITMNFKSSVSPMACSPTGSEDCKFIVLPIRLTVQN